VASFITNFLHGIGSGEHIKDYRHASNLFTHDNFRLSPKTAFLYHCLIKLNRQAVGYSGMSAMLQHEPELSFMVKAVDLPRMSVDIEELNQYNRKTYNMTKVNYSPITITFHDDSANTIRDFLANYYNYYFSDGSVSHDAQHDLRDGTGLRQSYSQNGFLGTGGAWGLDSTFTHEARGQNLLDYIQIYSLSKGRASGYKLINPILSGINHGTHDASAGGTPMEHSVTVNYEAIMYDEKQVSEMSILGGSFYDREKSVLSGAGGGTNSVLGPGGMFDKGMDIFGNLQQGGIGGIAKAAINAYSLKEQMRRFDARDSLKHEVRDMSRGVEDYVAREVGKKFATATRE